MNTHPQRHPETFQPLAGFLAILLPGLGYIPLKQPRRALLVAIPIFLLILTGLLLGGLDVVNRQAAFWWFIVQCGIGPLALVLDEIRAAAYAAGHLKPALAKINEVGTLCVVMAGMLNLIAIIDCFFHQPPQRRRPAPVTPPAPRETNP